MEVKSKSIVIMLLVSLFATGCGSSGGASVSSLTYDTNGMYMSTSESMSDGIVGDFYESSVESFDVYDVDSDYDYDKGMEVEIQQSPTVNRDMLIYRGNVSLTTKNFDEDLRSLKSMLDKYDSFFENENIWTEYTYDERDLYHYSATVRVSSTEYEGLLNALNGIGTMTSLSSSCENASAEYSDTIVAIDIYEAERDRYINLLSTITDDYYAIEVQRELTDIELKLAQYRARKQNIEMDVSYSYVTVDLREVREYEQQTYYKASFLERLRDTVVNTFYGFTEFLENVLFWLIETLPYIIFWSIVYLICKKIGVFVFLGKIPFVRNILDRRAEHKEEKRRCKEAINDARERAANDKQE